MAKTSLLSEKGIEALEKYQEIYGDILGRGIFEKRLKRWKISEIWLKHVPHRHD